MYHAPKGKGMLSTLAYFLSLGWEKRVIRSRACLVKKNRVFGLCSIFLRLGEGMVHLRERFRLGVGMHA